MSTTMNRSWIRSERTDLETTVTDNAVVSLCLHLEPVAPPTPAEVQRKLSVKSTSPVPITPGGRRRTMKVCEV